MCRVCAVPLTPDGKNSQVFPESSFNPNQIIFFFSQLDQQTQHKITKAVEQPATSRALAPFPTFFFHHGGALTDLGRILRVENVNEEEEERLA